MMGALIGGGGLIGLWARRVHAAPPGPQRPHCSSDKIGQAIENVDEMSDNLSPAFCKQQGCRGVSNDGNEHAVDDGVGISRCKGYARNCNDCLRACGAEASSFPQHGMSFRGRRGVLYNAILTQQTTGLLPVDDMSAMNGRARWAQPNNRKRCDRPRPSS